MAKIGLVSVGITGRVNASCEIARRLRARGHRLVLASTDLRAGERLRGSGVPFYPLDNGVPEELRQQARLDLRGRQRRQLRRAIAEVRCRSALEGHGIEGFIGGEQPDLLLVESELHDSILYLRTREFPVCLLEYHVSVHRHPGIPPAASGLRPDMLLARPLAAASWAILLARRRLRQALDKRYLAGWDARSTWERLARAAGERLGDIARSDQWPLLYYPDLPCIHLCASELDFPGAAGDGRDVAGPVIQRSRSDPPDTDEFNDCRRWLAERDRGRPLVVCATGSILTLPAFTGKMLALSAGAGFDLLIAAGRRANIAQLGALPPHVRAYRFIPQLEALAEASVFVCHGGISSIHESLLAGVPMLVCSGGCLDEHGNAARVEFHGLGLRGDMRRDTSAQLRTRIERLIRDDGFRHSVADMRETLESYVTDARLETLIEARLRRVRESAA